LTNLPTQSIRFNPRASACIRLQAYSVPAATRLTEEKNTMRHSHRRIARKFSWVVALAVMLALAALPAVAGGGGTVPPPPPPITVDVQILALNDFHGNLEASDGLSFTIPDPQTVTGTMSVPVGGVAYLAAAIDAYRAGNPNTVVVSAGDMIGASPLVSALFHDEPTIEAFNTIGLAYNAVGNHEFDEGAEELLRMQEGGCHPVDGCADGDDFPGADFQFLAANVKWKDSGETIFPAYAIHEIGGTRIAFIGMTLEGTPDIVTPSGISMLDFFDEADTVNALIQEIRAQGVRAIVVLLHEGGVDTTGTDYNDCTDISGPIVDIVNRLDPEVDAMISGHTHQAYNCEINGIPVTSASSFGRALTIMNLTINTASGDVTAASAENVLVTRDAEPVQPLVEWVDRYAELVAPLANRVVGAITEDILRGATRQEESALGDVIADAQLAATAPADLGGAQIAFMNPGGIRADLVYDQISGEEQPGEITYAESFTVQPFGNSLVTMNLSGEQIDTLLEQQFNEDGTVRLMLQISDGFTYCWDADAAQNEKVDPAYTYFDGAPIDPAATYRVTVNSFLADGGDGFAVLRDGTDRLGGDVDLDAFEHYFTANSPVPPGPVNRILSADDCSTVTLPAEDAAATPRLMTFDLAAWLAQFTAN
jgi:5'-nucleotidase